MPVETSERFIEICRRENLFDYLSGESRIDGRVYVHRAVGLWASLRATLDSIALHAAREGDYYSVSAHIKALSGINFNKLSDSFARRLKSNPETKKWIWSPSDCTGRGYISLPPPEGSAETPTLRPDFSIVEGRDNRDSKYFLIYLGDAGASPKVFGNWEDFNAEVGNLELLTDNFVQACLSLTKKRRPQKIRSVHISI